jgi:hypothetical protein
MRIFLVFFEVFVNGLILFPSRLSTQSQQPQYHFNCHDSFNREHRELLEFTEISSHSELL